jgi:hypothetical protein
MSEHNETELTRPAPTEPEQPKPTARTFVPTPAQPPNPGFMVVFGEADAVDGMRARRTPGRQEALKAAKAARYRFERIRIYDGRDYAKRADPDARPVFEVKKGQTIEDALKAAEVGL